MNGTDPIDRPLPALDPITEFYWTSGADGRLRIARCDGCQTFIHPPSPYCAACGGQVGIACVSGKGRVATFTVNEHKWVPGLEVPYVIAAIELVEQKELYVFANVVGCLPEGVHSGMDVEVVFEPHDGIFIPLFKPLERFL
jgi:uncharacterized OB-fold protein